MLGRGDEPDKVEERIQKESSEHWSDQLRGIDGLSIVSEQGLAERCEAVRLIIGLS